MADRNRKILVVDDSDTTREFLRKVLGEITPDIITCTDGMEGIESAIRNRPALIFLDLLMPNLDGLKMLRLLKMLDETKTIPVVVITANSTRSNYRAAMEEGADKVVLKPLDEKEVLEAVSEYVEPEEETLPAIIDRVEEEKNEFEYELLVAFLNSFPAKKYGILEALGNRNKNLLKQIIHQLKGTGATAGIAAITGLCIKIESELNRFNINWSKVGKLAEEVFEAVREKELTKPEAK